MNSAQEWLDAYSESHKNAINKRIHWICVPLIMLSLLGILWPIQIPFIFVSEYFNFCTMLIVVVSFYYFRLSAPMGTGMLLISLAMIFAIKFINQYEYNTNPYIIIFISSWIGQFTGHKIEGKKPSFFKDLQFLLIGPLWVLAQAYDYLNIKY